MEKSMQETQREFNDAYWASQVPEVRRLRDIQDEPERVGLAVQLASSGHIIDGPIMAQQWDPYTVMNLREKAGYTWVPSFLQPPITVIPGVHLFTLPDYDPNNPPANSIRVSTRLSDYPAYTPPKPVEPPFPGSESPVGAHNILNLYLVKPWDTNPDGHRVVEDRGEFVKHLRNPGSPFFSQWYEKVEKVG